MKLFKHLVVALAAGAMSFTVSAAELVKQVPALTLDGAKFAAQAAVAKAKSENWNVVIVVADAAGRPMYLEHMDGAQPSSLETALSKAKTSVMYKRPSRVFAERVGGGEVALMSLTDMLPFAGGVPIKLDGHVIGAVGVSGVKGLQDEEIAQAGVDALLKSVKK
ncbi:heme-binding protein [Neiella sp. HB171785]|uniref:Heme-binding protein n=1 Tax=Neiella litorisoli TaxID=2771431 RepID=A0A8J6QJR9_9GAMM|nr:heme-binding protein [Neiella litorisoli]MBD1390414.1 heme-binding protein [Neiella litorisoli]